MRKSIVFKRGWWYNIFSDVCNTCKHRSLRCPALRAASILMASQKCPCKQAFLLHGIIETRHNIRRNLHVILLRPREWRSASFSDVSPNFGLGAACAARTMRGFDVSGFAGRCLNFFCAGSGSKVIFLPPVQYLLLEVRRIPFL